MYITLETDYAIRMVRQLLLTGKRMDARTLSKETDVSLRFALKILGKLVSAGLIRSYTGIQGGYETARGVSEISLYDVIEAIEGSYRISRCLDGEYCCPRNTGDVCHVHQVFEEINRDFSERLRRTTFEQLL